MSSFTNRLIHETSPYLLQHAHNPVNWYAWSQEALDMAKKENKPILVSIGYSACHWCHVMEKESFEDEATARIMNEHFINIKIDREERPDLDNIYMDAVQAITGSGGWPLNVFLTPEGKPFYGGTYFPPKRAYNRPSWQEVLLAVSDAFRNKRKEIDAQAENLTAHLLQANFSGLSEEDDNSVLKNEKLAEIVQHIMNTADRQWGGFGRAPKFPQSFVIRFLLRYYYFNGQPDILQQAQLSIDKIIDGGIYDHVGGGFARYATDTEWRVPHFEKMLYDNALLLSALCEAYQLTHHDRYREVIDETIAFVQRELMHPDGGFFSALDADSEGEEGRFYVWKYNEVTEILKEEAPLFCDFYDIKPGGNWPESGDQKNILWRKKSEADFSKEKNISPEELKYILKSGKEKLLLKRAERTRPQLDDKILLGWNCLMNTALSHAYAATAREEYKQLAQKNMEFLLAAFSGKESNRFYHSWKGGQAKQSAFLDDYAYLIQSLITLQEITADTKYLVLAREIAQNVLKNFSDEEQRLFYYTPAGQKDVLLRKTEVYDGAQPSGNAVMAENIYRLSLYFSIPEWKERIVKTVNALGNAIVKYPTSFSAWACLLQELVKGTPEIAIVMTKPEEIHRQILQKYIPHKILMISATENAAFPLLTGKNPDQLSGIFLCYDYQCSQPVSSVEELLSLIRAK